MKIAIIIPALEPDKGLLDYVDKILSKRFAEVVVVDDGSSETSAHIFAGLAQKQGCTLLTHPQNRGKGAALKTAIAHIRDNMPHIEGVVTADADGQHSVADVMRMADKLKACPGKLVLGVREFDENTPRRSLVGNRISAATIKLLYGINLDDTQTGLRAVSRRYFDWMLGLSGERYEYELNMLIHSKKVGLDIETITIETLYFNDNDGSHFRTVRDGGRVYFQMFRGLIEYVRNSMLSVMVDITIFTLLFYFTESFLVATMATTISAVTARIISSLVDFRLNRGTFASKATTSNFAYVKYYTLWIMQIILSTTLVNLMNIYLGALQTVIKPVIDLCLATVSYQVQLRWVFVSEKQASDEGFWEAIEDLVATKEVQGLGDISQHSPDANRYEHSIYVAYTSYRLCKKLNLDARSAARGGLLHDFEIRRLVKQPPSPIVMFFIHNDIALDHANLLFSLSHKERDIIQSHMWPITPWAPPSYIESLIVNMADTYCATAELLGLYRRPEPRMKAVRQSI